MTTTTELSFLDRAKLIVPWLPESLLGVWADSYAELGDAALATAATRQDPAYDQAFPGNRRADGSLRYDELTYTSVIEGYDRVLSEAGINPALFAHRFVDLLEGDKSVRELEADIGLVRTRVLNNLDSVRADFGNAFGIGELTNEALLAAALDPDIGRGILERTIDIAEITGTATSAGFQVGIGDAARFLQRGFTQATFTDLTDSARAFLPSLNRSAQRFGIDKDVDFEEYAAAGAFGDPAQARRFARLQSQEAAQFTRSSVRRDQQGLTGLRER